MKRPGALLAGLTLLIACFALPHHAAMIGSAHAETNVVRIADSGAGVSKRLKLGLNKAIVVDLPKRAGDILVADPSIADAVTRTATRLYLFGKEVGQTNIFVFGPNGEEIVTLDLAIERDITGLRAQLTRFIPDSDIDVEIINDNIVLSGSVQTPQDASRASSLAQIFLTGGEATTRNLTAVGEGGDAAIFAEDRQQSQIVNLLTVAGEDQVTLKVTVAEVSRQVLKQLGFNMFASVTGSDGDGSLFGDLPANLGRSIVDTAGGNFVGSFGDLNLDSYISAMERAGVMRTLAEPSLTAISGEAATFFVGGEFPGVTDIGALDENGQRSSGIGTNQYGIGLDFTPVVLGPGRISLRVRTEVSEPTFEDSVSVSGGYSSPWNRRWRRERAERESPNNVPYPVPEYDYEERRNGQGGTIMSIRRREAETSVELPSGGSIVIAGLVRDDIRQAMTGHPGLSKVPVLGTLFRSRDFQRNETELVIIATPYLVRPTARSELARPDDNFNAAGDGAGFLLGRVNRVYGRANTDKPAGRYHGTVGFIYK